MKLGDFNWRSLKRYTSPQATQDLNHFLENLPNHAGHSVLIAAAAIWAVAGGMGLYTFVQSRALAELRSEFSEMESIKPNVPTVTNVAEAPDNVTDFVESAEIAYPDLEMRANGSAISISASDTRYFPQFREAIGHVQNGGTGWRVNIDELCVGRECSSNPLAIQLKVNRVSIDTTG